MTLRIRLNDSPLTIRQERTEVHFLEFTLGDEGPVSAYLVKESLNDSPDPDIDTATVTFDLWGAVDGVDTHILDSIACTVDDASVGLISFSLPAGGIPYEGDHFRGRFNVAYVDGRVESYPRGRQHITVLVRKQ